MFRVRKLVLAIAAASSLTTGMAHALGLGDVSLQSALNQPLNAEIELLEVRDLSSEELLPRLATPEEFSKAGVERQYFLTDLKFTPVVLPNGKSVIRVTSNKPVREPYLNFLVEVVWPSGRLLREYTLLLDPPLYSPETAAVSAPALPVATAAPVPKPVAAPAKAPIWPTASTPVAPVASNASKQAPTAPVAASGKIEGDQYKTSQRDTLWEIAERVRGGGSVHQTMLAIQELNPSAFIDGNINRLKSGQVLRIPDATQINARTRSQAITQVAEQNSAWREGRSLASAAPRQLDATKRTAANAAPAKVETKDNLRLVSADEGKTTAGADKGSADSKVLTDKLAVTQESLDSARREGDELKGRVTDLQGQLEKLQRLISLKDDQLAKLQVDLAAQDKAAQVKKAEEAALAAAAVQAKPVVTEPPVSEPVAAEKPADVVVPEVAPAAVEPAKEPEAIEPVVESKTAAEPDFNYNEEPPAKPAEVVAPEKPVKPAKPIEPIQIVTETVVVETPEPTSFVDDLMADPLLLGAGGAGVLVLLLGLMAMSRRNAAKAEADEVEAESDALAFSESDDLNLPDDSFAGLNDADAGEEAHPEKVTAQTADALGEAEIYIAYGKFTQAAELLQGALNNEPQRSDLRLKLMEVSAELGDRDGFQRQEQELKEIGGVTAEVAQLKIKYPSMVAGAAAVAVSSAVEDELDAFSLDDLAEDDLLAPASVAQNSDDAFDLNLDDLENDLESDSDVKGATQSVDDLDDFSLDIDIDEPEVAAPSSDDGALDFDLSLDDGAPATNSLKLDDDLAEFSLDLDGEAEPEVELALPADEEMSTDFDLSFAEDAPELDAASAPELIEEPSELAAEAEVDLGAPDEVPAIAEADDAADDDFDFLSGTDETATKLDLARAYIDMGDAEGARDILDEVIAEGSDAQQQEARELIAQLA